jgi:hypothetical protein
VLPCRARLRSRLWKGKARGCRTVGMLRPSRLRAVSIETQTPPCMALTFARDGALSTARLWAPQCGTRIERRARRRRAERAHALEGVCRAQLGPAHVPRDGGVDVRGCDLRLSLNINVGAGRPRYALTSSPGAMSLIATTRAVGTDESVAPRSGKTATAFGAHEWLNSATTGETATPMGVKSGADSVMLLVENYSKPIIALDTDARSRSCVLWKVDRRGLRANGSQMARGRWARRGRGNARAREQSALARPRRKQGGKIYLMRTSG